MLGGRLFSRIPNPSEVLLIGHALLRGNAKILLIDLSVQRLKLLIKFNEHSLHISFKSIIASFSFNLTSEIRFYMTK